jgi:hypothetical protein
VSILVLCPSRGRPAAAAQVVESFLSTTTADSSLCFVVDYDDPTKDAYPANDDRITTMVIDPPPGCMNAALNAGAASDFARGFDVIGFIGDDHRFRTKGWDDTMGRFLAEHKGIAYADDLFQRIRLPTMWFVSRPIVDIFGMGHPDLRHLWIDNYWRELGEAAGCLYYFEHIVIEHLHPAAGKAVWDENYLRVNSNEVADHDRGVYEAWRTSTMAADAERVKALIA